MTKRGGEPWSNDDVATLKRMYLAGHDRLSIAKTLERTEVSILNKIRLLRRRRAIGSQPGKTGITMRSYGA